MTTQTQVNNVISRVYSEVLDSLKAWHRGWTPHERAIMSEDRLIASTLTTSIWYSGRIREVGLVLASQELWGEVHGILFVNLFMHTPSAYTEADRNDYAAVLAGAIGQLAAVNLA